MTHRIAFALILTLASACVVAGEEDASLEEIQSRVDSGLITLYKGGKKVSYESLRPDERELLDLTLATIEDQRDYDPGWTCEGSALGWRCLSTDELTECECTHAASGPKCKCGPPEW
jgi:hypothetical protein